MIFTPCLVFTPQSSSVHVSADSHSIPFLVAPCTSARPPNRNTQPFKRRIHWRCVLRDHHVWYQLAQAAHRGNVLGASPLSVMIAYCFFGLYSLCSQQVFYLESVIVDCRVCLGPAERFGIWLCWTDGQTGIGGHEPWPPVTEHTH